MTNNQTNKKYAVVTGASKGLGKEFALELARRKINLLLVSLPNEGLAKVAEEVKDQGIDAAIYEADLSENCNIESFTNWVNSNFEIYVLINNAGFGGNNHFLDADSNYLDKIIQINIKATTLLTRQLMPNLIKQNDSYVLNVSSLAAYSPIAYKTVYPATKAFVHHFTRAMQEEFKHRNISFSIVNPGPMKTNGHVSERIEQQGFWVNIMVLHARQVAKITIRGMFKKRKVIMLNWLHRLGWFLLQVLPVQVKMGILSSLTKNEVRDL